MTPPARPAPLPHHPTARRRSVSAARALTLLTFLVLAGSVAPRPAGACAIFRDIDPTGGVAQLDTERILITYDPATKTEHFIREIQVAKGVKRFGFVVPLPSKPEIAKVNADLFPALQRDFPAVPPAPAPPAQSPSWFSRDKSAAMPESAVASAAVRVESEQKIGSFTVFTVAATDTAAFQSWLKENSLSSPPAQTRWLDHYVALGFTFVAFRFEGGADGAPLVSERVRLSFRTPAPFYPYLEPEASPGPTSPRALLAWVVSPTTLRPVAAHVGAEGGALSLTRGNPWTSGLEHEQSPALGTDLGDVQPLLPQGKLYVQTFTDRKRDRNGWGDIVFVPRTPTALPAAERDALRPLLPVLDPTLGGRSAIVSTGGAR